MYKLIKKLYCYFPFLITHGDNVRRVNEHNDCRHKLQNGKPEERCQSSRKSWC